MPQITMTTETVRVTRYHKITDAEPIRLQYRKTMIQPDEVVVAFRDGEWANLKVSGYNVRKDGSLGENRHSSEYYSWSRDDMPEWAVPLTRYEEG